jgi:hypothetical protein
MQNLKTTLGLIKVATIWILSRIFDVLPITLKVNVFGRFTGRFSERLIFAGKSRLIKWEVPDLNKKVKLKVSNKDDYFALLARDLIISWEQETLKAQSHAHLLARPRPPPLPVEAQLADPLRGLVTFVRA